MEINVNVKREIIILLTLYTEKCRRWYKKINQNEYKDKFFHYYIDFNKIKITKKKKNNIIY